MADNLLDKASILLTPTAYNDGSMLSVKPENGDGDFTFSRGSAATRVNEQGLVENVQIISSELVTNGDFATDSDWDKGNGTTISGGKANLNGSLSGSFQDPLRQFSLLTIGKTYKVEYTISNYVSGAVTVFGNGATEVSANGTYTQYITATITTLSFQNRAVPITCSIDNVSVKELVDDTDIPRIDYTDGCGVWLLEGQSTNLYLNSETLLTQSNATSASTYTVSFYGTGTITFSGTHTGTLVGTGANDRVSATFTATSGTLTSTISGTCTKGQLENLSYATSYIPTNGAIATRLADVATNSGNASLINSTEGVLYCDLKDYFRANLGGIGLYNQSGSAVYQIYYYGGNYDVYNGSAFIMDRSTIYPVESKIAVRWTSTAVTIFINGVDATKIGASLSANTPEVINMASINNGYSKAKTLAVFPILTDAELQSLTTI